ncbi:MAG: hypothetical protein BA863_04170 [Desulfovibrio sp. S3730MH75]|nr:MAG: hypothetical protein BA863_04170 [Desulfovibrio sp. S3730MH75]
MNKFTLTTILMILMLVFAASPSSATTYSFGGSDYWVVRASGMNWDSAKVLAEAAGGHLATITSAAENAYVQQNVLGSRRGEYWLGGFQTSDPGGTGPAANWEWVTGEAWSFTDWQPGEPNNYRGRDEMHLGIWSRNDWKWNDEGYLNNITGFVVEQSTMPPVPIPATFWLLSSALTGLVLVRRFAYN